MSLISGNGRGAKLELDLPTTISKREAEAWFGPIFLKWLLEQQVKPWLDVRPVLRYVDRQNPTRFAQLLGGDDWGEVAEVQQAMARDQIKWTATELGDILWFLRSHTLALTSIFPVVEPPDAYRIHHSTFGRQVGSDIFDRMRQVAMDIEGRPTTAVAANEELSALVLIFWRQEIPLHPAVVLEWVGRKNSRNRAAAPFSDLDLHSRQLLTPDEIEARYIYSNTALRILRQAEGNPAQGLSPELYDTYKASVIDFRRGEAGLEALRQGLTVVHYNRLAVSSQD